MEEGIRMILEVVNSALCSNLRNNSNLIYSILYKRDLFEQYHNHPMFHDLVWNIYMVRLNAQRLEFSCRLSIISLREYKIHLHHRYL